MSQHATRLEDRAGMRARLGDGGGAPSLRGRWHKQSTHACAAPYPQELEFEEETYTGSRGPAQRFTLWDSGMYRVDGPDRLVLATAARELVSYEYRLEGSRLIIMDRQSCQIEYVRMS